MINVELLSRIRDNIIEYKENFSYEVALAYKDEVPDADQYEDLLLTNQEHTEKVLVHHSPACGCVMAFSEALTNNDIRRLVDSSAICDWLCRPKPTDEEDPPYLVKDYKRVINRHFLDMHESGWEEAVARLDYLIEIYSRPYHIYQDNVLIGTCQTEDEVDTFLTEYKKEFPLADRYSVELQTHSTVTDIE